MLQQFLELGSLFGSAFLAATVLPIQSEAILAILSRQNIYEAWFLVVVATTGNTLGAVVNWWLGKYLIHFKDRKWFPIKEKTLNRVTRTYQKYGVWSLLLAWTPFLGDPLTMVAGIFRTHIITFLILVSIGKSVRYIGVLWLFG